MSADPQQQLKELQPTKKFFIGIDSDGCVFDSMELKHKECFCPAFINNMNLQAVSKYARETWEFVNLYSKTRGCNRFLALITALDLLAQRPEVKLRNIELPTLDEVRSWTKRETKLGQAALSKQVESNPNPQLQQALNWSVDVTDAVHKIVRAVAPLPYVRDCMEKMKEQADILCVSQTPVGDLTREWREHDIEKYARIIAGQEMGTKTEHIKFAAGGKYPAENILMIGDAPGDYKAAQGNNASFYPINPGDEENSWKRLFEEGLEKFFNGTFSGDYQAKLLAEFDAHLPELPPWKI